MLLQTSLFEEKFKSPIDKISGLTYIPEFITAEQEVELTHIIDQQPWLADLKRRVQHYGYKYDYTARRVDESMRLGAIPDWLMDYCQKLHLVSYFLKLPDQVIINEYEAGQGIASHVDCVPCFEEIIGSISLGSPVVMDFTHSKTNEKIPILLEPRSLFLLSGDARYVWKHGIANRKSDKHNGIVIPRHRRASMTFRKVII
jgi:alkylated DNA repair dioxygenase AlkB